MYILFIASYYPPYAPMAGTRIGKLTGYFHRKGHEVRVLGAANPAMPPLLRPGIPEERITYVGLDQAPGLLSGAAHRLRRRHDVSDSGEATEGGKAGTAEPRAPGLLDRLRATYRQAATIPDGYNVWRRPAVEAGLRLIEEARPDLLYASLPQHSGFLVGADLARRTGVPLVVEYRDLWVDHPYYSAPAWRRLIETRMERRAARQVAAYVTVTEGWRDFLEGDRHRPTALVLNGFDPDDFTGEPAAPLAPEGTLSLFYAGALYGEKRDPSPLFEALRRMGDEARAIRVLFHTDATDSLEARVKTFGLEGIIEVCGPVPQAEVLAKEKAADVLLLLRWDHPSEETVLAGKLFEYIGAGRPILSVGLETGEAARLIEDNGFGLVSKDPDRIAAQLRLWLAQRRAGGVAALDPARASRFSRDRQFEALEGFLDGLLPAR
jgi:glycosyltransferase involved in cell wall biosynthesis